MLSYLMLHVAIFPPPPAPPAGPAECTNPAGAATCNYNVDVMLAVDNSFSVANITDDITDFLALYVSQFGDNAQGTRMGLISFGSTAELRQPLDYNLTTVLAPRGDQGPSTAITLALSLSKQVILGSRPAAAKTVMLLTDGHDTVGGDGAAIAVAASLKVHSTSQILQPCT